MDWINKCDSSCRDKLLVGACDQRVTSFSLENENRIPRVLWIVPCKSGGWGGGEGEPLGNERDSGAGTRPSHREIQWEPSWGPLPRSCPCSFLQASCELEWTESEISLRLSLQKGRGRNQNPDVYSLPFIHFLPSSLVPLHRVPTSAAGRFISSLGDTELI